MNCPRCNAEMPDNFEYCGICGASLVEGETDLPEDGAVDDQDRTGELEWADVKTLGPSFDRRPSSWRRKPLAAARDMTIDLGKLRDGGWPLEESSLVDEMDEMDEMEEREEDDGNDGTDEKPEVDAPSQDKEEAQGPLLHDSFTFSSASEGPEYDETGNIEGEWDFDVFDETFPRPNARAVEPEVVSADAIAYLKRHRKGGRLIYVAIIAVLAIAGLIGFSVWNNSYSPYEIDAATFPDAGVRAAVAKADADGDGKLSRDEAAETKSLEIEGAESISGLGMFSNLESLSATGAQLESVELSGLGALKQLNLAGSGVREIDLSPCPLLESFDAHGSQLGSLEAGTEASLAELDVSGTRIDKLDVSGNPSLASLACDDHVAVTGIDSTGLQEYWLVTAYTATSMDQSNQVNTTRISTTYDEENKLTNITFMNSETTGYANYRYDEEGRIAGLDHGTGTELDGAWILGYDDAGHLVSAIDAVSGAAYAYAYDEAGRLSSFSVENEARPDGYGSSSRHDDFVYDEAGRLVQITGDDGASIEYDPEGRITSYRSENGTYTCDFVYDPNGRCIAATRVEDYSEIEESFLYDEGGHLTSATRDSGWSNDFEAVEKSAFSCDSNGNITSATITGRDDAADTCMVSYRRIFAAPDKAPVGITPQLGDPLQYCLVKNWIWQPWTLQAPSADNDIAFIAAFHPGTGIVAPSMGLPVIPVSKKPAAEEQPAPEEQPAAEGEAAPTEEPATEQPADAGAEAAGEGYAEDGSEQTWQEEYVEEPVAEESGGEV